MKKSLIFGAISLAAVVNTQQVSAATTQTKQAAVFSGSALLGAAVAGPIGLIGGAVAGAVIGEDIKQGDIAKQRADKSEQKISQLEQELAMAEALVDHMEDKTQDLDHWLQNLPGEVYFDSSSDKLNKEGLAIVELLAQVIKQSETTKVEIVGHTDPRGTDEFNNVLSQYRAKEVEDKLIQLGIKPDVIASRGEGASHSTAAKGDALGYAFERRVDIIIHTEDVVAHQDNP